MTTRVNHPGLEPLDRLARNLAWTWDPEIAAVLAEIDPEGLARAAGNPVAMLAGASPARLDELAGDGGFRERLSSAAARLDERIAAPRWYATLGDAPGAIAYFSPEFGLSEALPQYSGGLGILAGDHLKAASDLGVPIVGVGLFYRNGYFRQLLTVGGAQQEQFVELDPALLPMTPVIGADGSQTLVSVPLPGAVLHAAALARRRRAGPAAPAGRGRGRQCAGRARRHRPPVRRRQRAPAAPGDPARHRGVSRRSRHVVSRPPCST